MFIMNYKAITPSDCILVDYETKQYLESLGYCPISYDKENDKWAFQKNKDILNIIKSKEGGNHG